MTGRTRKIATPARELTSALVALACATFSHAQSAATPALAEQRKAALAAESSLPAPKAERTISFELSPARQERFRKFLPRAWRTLSQREPFRVLAVGDSILQVAPEPGQNGSGAMAGFPAMFARELATQFYYTGGVHQAGSVELSAAALAPTITVRQLARPGGSVLDAAQILATTGRQAPADLLILCYGRDDAASMSPPRFARAIEEALDAARAMNLEVILCSPFPAMADRAEMALGLSRPFANILRQIAIEEGVLHVDLGDLSRLIRVMPDTTDEAHVFEAVARAYRSLFREDPIGIFLPRANLHAKLGSVIFQELLDAAPPVPWTIAGLAVNLNASDRLTLRYQIHNKADEEQTYTIFPLIASGWKPLTANPRLTLRPGTRQTLEIQYGSQNEEVFAGSEPSLCLPLLVSAGNFARMEDLRASMHPVAIVWGAETFFNHEGPISPACQLVNSSKETIQGTWQASFSGKNLEGNFQIKPDSSIPLDLKFDLPAPNDSRQILPLSLVVRCKGVELAAQRQVEITSNIGLNQPVPLRVIDPAETPGGGVELRAEADVGMLFLTCELGSVDVLLDQPQAGPAWQMVVNLDARSYGKRLNRGTTASLQATGKAADGPGHVHEIAPWSFGNEYAATFDPKEINATLSSTTGGARRITMAIPRTYLYLHEWALDNGNSQLGINVRLTLHHQGQDAKSTYHTFALARNSKPVDDVDSLAVLELTLKPTKRVTVNIF